MLFINSKPIERGGEGERETEKRNIAKSYLAKKFFSSFIQYTHTYTYNDIFNVANHQSIIARQDTRCFMRNNGKYLI